MATHIAPVRRLANGLTKIECPACHHYLYDEEQDFSPLLHGQADEHTFAQHACGGVDNPPYPGCGCAEFVAASTPAGTMEIELVDA